MSDYMKGRGYYRVIQWVNGGYHNIDWFSSLSAAQIIFKSINEVLIDYPSPCGLALVNSDDTIYSSYIKGKDGEMYGHDSYSGYRRIPVA